MFFLLQPVQILLAHIQQVQQQHFLCCPVSPGKKRLCTTGRIFAEKESSNSNSDLFFFFFSLLFFIPMLFVCIVVVVVVGSSSSSSPVTNSNLDVATLDASYCSKENYTQKRSRRKWGKKSPTHLFVCRMRKKLTSYSFSTKKITSTHKYVHRSIVELQEQYTQCSKEKK